MIPGPLRESEVEWQAEVQERKKAQTKETKLSEHEKMLLTREFLDTAELKKCAIAMRCIKNNSHS
jgi:hypothetical protein